MKDCTKVCWSIAPLTQFDSGTYSIETGTDSVGTDGSGTGTGNASTMTDGTGTGTENTGTHSDGYSIGTDSTGTRTISLSNGTGIAGTRTGTGTRKTSVTDNNNYIVFTTCVRSQNPRKEKRKVDLKIMERATRIRRRGSLMAVPAILTQTR